MNENLDLVKVLKDCPNGTKLYSKCLGTVKFNKVIQNRYIEIVDNSGRFILYRCNGKLKQSSQDAEIDLFPSKDQYDWSKWQKPFADGDILATDEKKTYHNTRFGFEKLLDFEKELPKINKILNMSGYEWDAEKNELKTLQSFKVEDKINPWTIRDAKNGDVISYDDGWTCIFKCIHGIWYSSYCFITNDGEFYTGYEDHEVDYGNAHLATKEQCDLLFQKMKEAGYKWNAETKTLEKLIVPKFKVGYDPSKFDITTLKPFDKVLVRDDNTSMWTNAFYGFYDTVTTKKYPFVANACNWTQCIPYEGNEHLLGTDDDCDEYYKNW